jgi:type IV pilus assembly protein PilO
MTFTGDFTSDSGGKVTDPDPAYPVIFGVSLTPTITGLVIAVLGLLGAAYCLVTYVQPLWQTKQQLEQAIADKQAQLSNQAKTLEQIAEVEKSLANAKQQQADVLSLYADDSKLKTLLLDLNRIVRSRNGTLVRFEPATPDPETVADGSLGGAVNGKIRRQAYKVEIEGTFEETRSIILTLERLQPLLVVKALKSELGSQKASLRKVGNKSAVLEFDPAADKLKTTFDLLALLPASPAPVAASPSPPPQ